MEDKEKIIAILENIRMKLIHKDNEIASNPSGVLLEQQYLTGKQVGLVIARSYIELEIDKLKS